MVRAFLSRNREYFRFLKPLWAGYRATFAALPWRWLPGSSREFGPPRGLHARTVDYLAAGPGRGRAVEVQPALVRAMKMPRSIAATVHWKFRKYAELAVAPVTLFELNEVRFWGDYAGTLIGSDDRVLGDLTIDVWEARRHRIFSKLKLPACRRLSGTTAILACAEAEANYWHWTMELLPKVKWLQRAGWRLEDIDWFVINHRDLPFQRETLEDLGIPWSKIVRADAGLHIECERALGLSLKAHQYAVAPDDCLDWQARAARRWPDAVPRRRLYITRENAVFRRLTNEAEVLERLRPRGFEVVHAERHTVMEQRRLFREAAVVIGPHGSAMTNLIFCQPGTKLLEFVAPRYADPVFWVLANHVGVEHWMLIGEGEVPPDEVDPLARQEDITLDLGKLDRTLAAMGI